MKRLLASIHDVGPRFEGEVDRLADRLAPFVGQRLAMLVVPDHWGEAPIRPGSPFAARLRGWAEAGVEMFVHGWFHRDDTRHAGRLDRWRGARMTAGEGEFLGLDEADALDRMARGRALVEEVTGRAAAGFIAPAWLYSAGARAALGRAGFAIAEDHLRVWSPVREDAVLARGPVVTWASRSRARQASSLAAAAVLAPVLARAATVRVAVHPGDVRVPALLASIDRTMAAFTKGRAPARYADLPGA